MKPMLKAVLFTLLAAPVFAQAVAHQAALTWTAPSDAIAGTTYNVSRVNAACPTSGLGGLTWKQVNNLPITTTSYTDTTIGIGQWCYYVTQVTNGVESAPSTTAGGTAKPNTVTFTVTIQ